MMTDPIADLLTRIRNAQQAGHEKIDVKSSKLKVGILKALKKEGFIKNYKFTQDNKQGMLRIYLRYDDENKPAINGLKRISKPGQRKYTSVDEISSQEEGFSVTILSTPKGILSDKEAKAERVGGEVLFTVW